MKLHDLHPAPGSRTRRTRVGRGIAAGGGKTAGRGTKGQKARAGGSIPAWFEGGQTPLHMRIPKLRGFRNPFKIEYEVVNLGRIAALVELGALEVGEPADTPKPKSKAAAPITVNQEILRAVGLVRTLDKPMKVLGQGEIDRALFVVADAFSKSAVAKIEAAGGSVQVLQVPTSRRPALGVETPVEPAEASAGAETTASAGAEPAEATATVVATGQSSGEAAAEAAEATLTVEPVESAAEESAPVKRPRPSAAVTPKSKGEAKAEEAKAATAPKTAKAPKAATAPKATKPAATARPVKPARTARKTGDPSAADAPEAAREPAAVDDETSSEAPAGTDA
jgi:large subunit ribosomal protein L15